ncbi:MAG: bifunctional precorrin-2 dehydrogenase/sirohydrochlorin ferrochelatase, partial [Actinomycetota bacterium]|nr:bifunctional precorrin-2 dehydrogenase/sirohydrochlorin ferrochelatase [Actinomycetota bacterium]
MVVGGGAVATRRVPALVEAGARVLVVSPSLGPLLHDLAARGVIRWQVRPYAAEDLDGAWLVHACTDDGAVNAAVAADCEARRIWCVRADEASASSAWTPARTSVDGVTVAVLAGGDPRRATAARDGIADFLRRHG